MDEADSQGKLMFNGGSSVMTERGGFGGEGARGCMYPDS